MFGLDFTGITIFWLLLGCLVGVAVEIVLFKAACALADVADPSWLVSCLVAVPFFIGRALVAAAFFALFESSFSGFTLYGLAFLTSGVIFWLLCVFLYMLILSISLQKSLWTASAQTILDVLAGSLALGIIFFTLSILQVAKQPSRAAAGPAGIAARQP